MTIPVYNICDSGCYQLYIKVPSKSRIKVGALGAVHFKRGYYVYTGRAKKNLKARITRHQRQTKKKHWHIDYLLESAQIIFIKCFPGRFDECIINEDVTRIHGDAEIIRGFGASDCRCPGHLIYLGKSLPEGRLG
jgi:Uri superfamily endonuclease